VVAALAAAGLPVDEFLFAGFLPARRGARQRALERLRAEPRTIILYEAPHRLAESLEDAAAILGDRPAVVARELTKLHEEFVRGTLLSLAAQFAAQPPRGEITLLIGPASLMEVLPVHPEGGKAAPLHGEPDRAQPPGAFPAASLPDRVELLIREQGFDRKSALKQAARERGLSRREAYKLLHT
jgi:16S rRNA (cytidine1402-2'-O)-methyltransferase